MSLGLKLYLEVSLERIVGSWGGYTHQPPIVAFPVLAASGTILVKLYTQGC